MGNTNTCPLPIADSPPVNNLCMNPIVLTHSGQGNQEIFDIGQSFTFNINEISGDNCNARGFEGQVSIPFLGDLNYPPTCPGGPGTDFSICAGVWFKLTVARACEIDIQLDTCDSGGEDAIQDSAIAIYKGSDTVLAQIAADFLNEDDVDCFDLQCVDGADDGGCETSDFLTNLDVDGLSVNGTETYYILLYSGTEDCNGVGTEASFGAGDYVLNGVINGVPDSHCGGDPHFSRWRHEKRDSFHGECDLVLLHSDTFHDKTGLDVHVRTTMMENDFSYSYIEAAAVRIGETILEFHPKVYRINGVDYDYVAVPSFDFEEQGHTYKVSSTATGTHKRETTVELNNLSSIKIRATKNLMYVNFEGGKKDFGDSVGMLGNYTTGEMYGRHGLFEQGDYNAYGFEWQVDPNKNDPILFADQRAPQLPYERCRIPVESSDTSRRRLRAANSELSEQAMEACKAATTDFELCVDDVMATGDVETAEMFVRT